LRAFASRGFRTSRRGIAWLALLALVARLVLAVAHVHALGVPAGDATLASAATAGGSSLPSPSAPLAPDTDHCEICLALHLAGSFLLPDGIAVAVPGFVLVAAGLVLVALLLARPKHFLFLTRAPPVLA
jgi:hypothetical protein